MADPWEVFDYEVEMFEAMVKFSKTDAFDTRTFQNAMLESYLLHIRILADIFLSSGGSDDIKIRTLIDGFKSPGIAELKRCYETGEGGYHDTINKKLVHASKTRSDYHHYTKLLADVEPKISQLIADVRAARPKP